MQINKKVSNKKRRAVSNETALFVLMYCLVNASAFGNCTGRACSCTSTAGYTNISVDVVL